MKFNVALLKKIIGGNYFNLPDEYEFSFLDIVKPSGELADKIDNIFQKMGAYENVKKLLTESKTYHMAQNAL